MQIINDRYAVKMAKHNQIVLLRRYPSGEKPKGYYHSVESLVSGAPVIFTPSEILSISQYHDAHRSRFGTDPRLLHRSDSPETSVEAANAVDSTRLEKMVYEDIASFGDDGCIANDLLRLRPGFPYSSITARFAALERKELIYYRGDKRKGDSGRNQRIMRIERRKQARLL